MPLSRGTKLGVYEILGPIGMWSAIAVAAVALVAAGGTIAWTLARTPPAEMPSLAVTVLTPRDVEIKGTPALSPDGGALAFAGLDGGGSGRIWVRPLDAAEARPVSGTDGGDQPFWSPDGRSLGFFARGKLWTLDLRRGEPPRVLADASDPQGGTWSREGIIVFAPGPDRALFRISADGGPAMPLSTLNRAQQEVSHRWPRFMPDGRVILFMNRMGADPVARHVITAISVDGGGIKALLEAESTGVYANGHLLFHRGGKVFAQPFDNIELNLSGDARLVADHVWNDTPGTTGLAGFDAAGSVFASRPAAERERFLVSQPTGGARVSLVHLRFNWTAIEPH